MTARCSLADLLAGCRCAPCTARDAARSQPHRPPARRRTAWISSALQLELYGYAVTERTVTVH